MNSYATYAAGLAKQAHADHTDKSGQPYVGHLSRVAAAVAPDDTAEAVAWLHDLVEDRPKFTGYLCDFPMHIVRPVYLLTKTKGEPDETYFARIKADPVALKVKLADIADNMSAERMGRLDEPTQVRLREKYARALALLTDPTGAEAQVAAVRAWCDDEDAAARAEGFGGGSMRAREIRGVLDRAAEWRSTHG